MRSKRRSVDPLKASGRVSIERPEPPFFLFGHQGLTWCIPYGYNSHRSRLGRDNRPKLFRKTNIADDVAGALHHIVGRSGPDTVGLFTFLTLSDFRVSLGSAKSMQGATPISLS